MKRGNTVVAGGRIFLLFVIAAGVALRITGLSVPDLSTDEAQAAFGVSPAWTPLGMGFLRAAQWLFGANIIAVRSVSIALGILTLPIIFGIAKRLSTEPTALLVTAVAAIFPSHVLFSRLAYLSVPLSFAWALLLLAFLRAREKPEPRRLIALFGASVLATLIKTQGLLLPMVLLMGNIIERSRMKNEERKTVQRINDITRVLLFSLIPVSFYIPAHPGIAATLILYGGNMYGISDIGARVATLVSTWWNILGLFLIAIVLSLRSLKTLPWPVLALSGIAALMGLVLGPGHGYYATHLVLFSIPVGLALARLRPLTRNAILGVLLLTTIMMLGPWRTPWSQPLFTERGFWNTHAAEINEVLRGEEAVTVLGSAGHHIRWYLEPRVLVGNAMVRPGSPQVDPPYPTNSVVLLDISKAATIGPACSYARCRVEYAAEGAAVIRLK